MVLMNNAIFSSYVYECLDYTLWYLNESIVSAFWFTNKVSSIGSEKDIIVDPFKDKK